MAFGLTQWLISFAIFLIVLTIITWSAIHLGRKSQNSTDIIFRSLDVNDYSLFEWEKYVYEVYLPLCRKEVFSYLHAYPFSKLLHSTIVRNSTSRVVESTDSPTLFANDQGSEIPDSSHFYKIFRTFYSTDSAVNSAKYGAATATPSVVRNDSTWKDDTTITLHNIPNKTFVLQLNDRRNVSGEVTILPDHNSQAAHSALTHETTLLDMNKLWKSDLSESVGTEPSELLQDKRNETSNVSVAFSFVQALSDAK